MDQKAIDRLPLAPKGQQKIKVPDVAGLYLVVGTTKKTWLFQRDLKGKEIKLTLPGAFTLKEAKAWAGEQRVLMERGHNPAAKPEPVQPKDGPGNWTVRQLMERRLTYMRDNGYSKAAIADFEASMRYISIAAAVVKDDKDRVIFSGTIMSVQVRNLTKSMCAAVHRAISIKGVNKPAPVQANKALDYLSASWKYASNRLDDHNTMPDLNVSKAIDRNPVGKVQASIDDLSVWAQTVTALPNPIRRHMHRIGLLTGLRWETLRCLEWAWIDGNKLTVPPDKIKARRGAVLPLSGVLMQELSDLRKAVEFMAPGSRYLFPSPTSASGHMETDDDRPLIARGWPGKLRRKTYRGAAEAVGCPNNIAAALLDHAAPGLQGNYLHRAAMFDDLLRWQETISNRLTSQMGGK